MGTSITVIYYWHVIDGNGWASSVVTHRTRRQRAMGPMHRFRWMT